MEFWGITGRIGSGKSSMLLYLQELGYRVLDADKVARDVTRPAHPDFADTQAKIIELVGSQAFLGEQMNRAFVRSWFTKGTQNKAKLTALIHPLVRDEIVAWMEESRTSSALPFAFIEAIDMFHSEAHSSLSMLLDGVIAVLCTDEEAITRAIQRDGRSRKDIEEILKLQMSDSELESRATFVVRNDGNLAEFKTQIKELLARISALHGKSHGD